MPSEIIPSLDLAPSVPSRVVTVHATDVTKGTALAGETVTFKLRGDLRVPADGAIISAGSATLTLDAQGKGRVRLPCYTDDTRADSADGEWYLEVKKSWVGQTDLIRVPVGSTQIALASIEPVREIPLHLAPSWLVTGAGVEIVEGSQWGVTVTVNGGVARFRFTVPPGGEAWAKGTLTESSVLANLPPAAYHIGSGSLATQLGLPVPRAGSVEVLQQSTPGKLIRFTTNNAGPNHPLEIWLRATDGTGAWVNPWRRAYPLAAEISTVELPSAPWTGQMVTVLATESSVWPSRIHWDSTTGSAPRVAPGERLICALIWDGHLWRGTYGLPYPRIILDSFTANSGTPVGSRPTDTGETWTIAGGEYEIRAVDAPDDLRARKITNSATPDHDTALVRWGTYDMRVSADGMHGAKLVARAEDSQSFYQLEVSVHGALHVGHMTDGVRSWMAQSFRTATPDARYALEVTTAPVGAAVTVYENGEVVWTGMDTRSRRPVGRWGGFVISTTVGRLDNLKIEAP